MSNKPQYSIKSIVSLTPTSEKSISDSPLFNDDNKPVSYEKRSWTTYSYLALWIGLSVCTPTYMLASGLIAAGMSAYQALFTIMLGQLIIMIPLLLNSIPGTKYGIPYPVFCRVSFGVRGAQIPAILRAVIGAGWFAINTWLGGTALNLLFISFAPNLAFDSSLWVCFLLMWVLNLWIGYGGPGRVKIVEHLGSPLLIILMVLLLGWGLKAAGGLGPIFAEPSRLKTSSEFYRIFFPSLTAMIGYWASLSLNISDFTRFAKDQKSQLIGQAVGLPLTMAALCFISVVATSATVIVFGEALWDPVELMSRFSRPVILLSAIGFILATITTNVAANIVSPVNDIVNISPKNITFQRGVIALGLVALVMRPWTLLETYGAYIFGWLTVYASLLGPFAGIYIVDFWILRKRRLALKELFVYEEGRYFYKNGFNIKAIIAYAIGVIMAFVGKFVPGLAFLYEHAFMFGLIVGGLVYYLIARGGDSSMVSEDDFNQITEFLESPADLKQPEA